MSDTDKDAFIEGAGCLLGLVMVLPMSLYSGWIASYLWGWFVTPTFAQPVPSVPLLAGLMATWKYFTWSSRKSPKEGALESTIRSIIEGLLVGGIVLLLGFILHRIAA